MTSSRATAGTGMVRAVLVHGAVNGGRETWQPQQPLSEAYELVIPDRQGYAVSGPDAPDDPQADAVTISELLGDGAHLVGFSMGGMVAMLAAARKPAAVRSLVLVEPVAFDLVRGREDAEAFIAAYEARRLGADNAERFLREFLGLLGATAEEVAQIPDPMPEEMRKAAVAQFTGTPPWQVTTPVDELAEVAFPIVVVSGGHSPMYDAICDTLAARIGAHQATLPGAGHSAQFTGQPFNALLETTWKTATPRP